VSAERITEILCYLLYKFIYVPALRTHEVISDALDDVLKDWQMENMVSTMTLDNYTINDNLMDAMQHKLVFPSLMLDGKLLRMCCVVLCCRYHKFNC
jgi:hypothetical protein